MGDSTRERAELLLGALRASVERLERIVHALSSEQLRDRAYPSEWTIADVLSHIGSGAVIMRRRLEQTLAGEPDDDGFNTATWDAWNAKPPEDQAADALVTSRALLDELDAVDAGGRVRFSRPFGPLQLDFAGFVQLRLNEQVVHVWDIAVALDPSARLPADATGLLLDSVGMLTSFAGKASPDGPMLRVRTTEPVRDLTVTLGPDQVEVVEPAGTNGEAASGDVAVDVELPAEAFVRLVYGRLDPEHTPAGLASPHLGELRRAFPGF